MNGTLPPGALIKMGFTLPPYAGINGEHPAIPRNFTILGDFSVSGNRDLEIIESDFQVLPNEFTEDIGNFSAQGCPNLQIIGDRMKVAGDCNLSRCPNLRSIGDGAEIGGDLNVSDCPHLTFRGSLLVGGRIFLPKGFDLSLLGKTIRVIGQVIH